MLVAAAMSLATACADAGSDVGGEGVAGRNANASSGGASVGSVGGGGLGGAVEGGAGGSLGDAGRSTAGVGATGGASGESGVSGAPSGASGQSGASTAFPVGTVCNSSGVALKPPARIRHLIVILFENENEKSVIGAEQAPYISSLATKCGVATAYQDDTFAKNLVSLPHYLALTSGSNCNTGIDDAGTGCITDDGDASQHALQTPSIFSQSTSWKAYQEGMSGACAKTSGGRYATKHNPAAYYAPLKECSSNDLSIPSLTCSATKKSTACTPAPDNAFVSDLKNDDLAEFTFVTPTLDNDMHDGTITQADNWVATYVPLILESPAYLRGEVVVQLLWDEQTTSDFGGPIPNVFISPYVTAGRTSTVAINHFSVLRSWEQALGIATYLGCASGSPPGGVGKCPPDSTADVRAALGW